MGAARLSQSLLLEATQSAGNVLSRCLLLLGELLTAYLVWDLDSDCVMRRFFLRVRLACLLALRLHSSLDQSPQNALTATGAWRLTC
jgi:hypothetical protein